MENLKVNSDWFLAIHHHDDNKIFIFHKFSKFLWAFSRDSSTQWRTFQSSSTLTRKWTRNWRKRLRKFRVVNHQLKTQRKSQTKKKRKRMCLGWPQYMNIRSTYAWTFTFRKKSNVITKVFQCCALNGGIFLLSLLFFDFILIPSLRNIITYFMGESPLWNFIQTTLSWIFSFIWVVPLFVLSKIINTFWFQDIAGKFIQNLLGMIPLTISQSHRCSFQLQKRKTNADPFNK